MCAYMWIYIHACRGQRLITLHPELADRLISIARLPRESLIGTTGEPPCSLNLHLNGSEHQHSGPLVCPARTTEPFIHFSSRNVSTLGRVRRGREESRTATKDDEAH